MAADEGCGEAGRAACAAAGRLFAGAGLPGRAGRPAGGARPRRRRRAAAARFRPAGAGPGGRAGAGHARRLRLTGHRGQRRAQVLRLRHRRRAADRAGRRLADRGLGPERRAVGHVTDGLGTQPGGAALGDRAARPARWHRRGFRHRSHHGERDLPGRGQGRGAHPAWLGRGGPGPGRRPAGHRGGGRAGAHHRAQGARPGRAGPGPRRRAARRPPGPDRAARPARAQPARRWCACRRAT